MDSLSVFPNSIQLNYPADSSVSISYDINTNKATLHSTKPIDSIHVCFSVLPYRLHRPYFKRDLSKYDSNAVYKEDYTYRRYVPDKKEELFASPGINKTGNISRGISFGNNQNVFVNSVLNLQLEGKLTDDVSITAVISDQNIPFQPDGNTQQLQEFDKVYVQLKSKRANLIAGDLVMKNRSSNFLKYYRNVQGAQGEYYGQGKDSSIHSVTTAGIAISKGKFNSIQFGYGLPDSLTEGVQGPYRLRGPNGERFIIVLANSEKVYLDGRLLKRGWDYDYVINYNTAEITFTNNVLITKFSRVRVDFEYSDKNYSRTIMNFSHYQDYKKVHAFMSYYIEKDNPNNPLVYDLTEQDKQYLSGIGDTLSRAVVSGIDSVGYTANKILYKKINVGGQDVYSFSTNPDSAFYDVKFSEVTQGQGRYIVDPVAVNGTIYKYVGLPNGNYEPVQLISTPKKKQMLALGGSVDISKVDNVFLETAFSTYDQNLYSPSDDADNNGYSYKVGYANKGRKVSFSEKYKWVAGLDYEFNSKTFTAIDRFRNTDFERDWSENTNIIGDNNILNASTGFVKNEKNRINYLFTQREKVGDVNGNQQTLTFNQTLGKFQFLGTGFLMNNNGSVGHSNWERYNTNIYYTTRYLVPGVMFNMEHNTVSDSVGNIIRTSMYYDEHKFYVRNNDSIKFHYFMDYAVRTDKEAYSGTMQPNSRAETTNMGLGGKVGKNHTVNTTFTYRYQDNDRGPTKSQNEETVMGRGEWNADLFKRHVRSELLMSSATGRELKRQFVYVAVATGMGTYVWHDFNGDGIQQLNEFVEKVLDDPNGEYIKTYVPTDQYIKAYSNTFNYRVDASAPRKWRGSSSGVKKFFSKFSNVSSWTVNKKLLDKNIASRFLPFYTKIADSNLLSYQNNIRSTLFFNRTSPSYGVEINYANTESKNYLSQGFDKKQNNDIGANTRLNLKKIFNVKLTGNHLIRYSSSTYMTDRNYSVEGWKITPSLSIQPKNTFRITANFAYTTKKNQQRPSPGEAADLYETGLEVKVNKLSRRTLTGNFKFINISANMNGTSPNSPIAYEMFEALQVGKNFTWSAVWQEKLVNGLQLSFNYEGRKTADSKVIHIGRMQVSALF
ncbi:MAG TPA: hypothetical protein VNB90_14335 [Cytophagaceae bacterium]|nr:hypothetical protein [Cytophagaceae bacterium]